MAGDASAARTGIPHLAVVLVLILSACRSPSGVDHVGDDEPNGDRRKSEIIEVSPVSLNDGNASVKSVSLLSVRSTNEKVCAELAMRPLVGETTSCAIADASPSFRVTIASAVLVHGGALAQEFGEYPAVLVGSVRGETDGSIVLHSDRTGIRYRQVAALRDGLFVALLPDDARVRELDIVDSSGVIVARCSGDSAARRTPPGFFDEDCR